MSSASKTLTTMSLGSCDAADYAAGVRVLQEFGRGEREGFIAQEETVAAQAQLEQMRGEAKKLRERLDAKRVAVVVRTACPSTVSVLAAALTLSTRPASSRSLSRRNSTFVAASRPAAPRY